MNKLLITLGLFVLFYQCTSHKPKETNMKVQVKISNKLDDEFRNKKTTFYSVNIDLINDTDSTVSFWLMSCSWQDNWIINSDSVRFYYQGCDSNFPELKQILSGQKLTFIGILQVLSPLKIEIEKDFMIGFVEIKQHEYLVNSDFRNVLIAKIKDKKDIIWSKAFKFKN